MSAARIRSRKRADGSKTHLVVYRRGGRAFPEEYAGTFALLREARTRRDLVGGWLAQGLDPRTMLGALLAPPSSAPTLRDRYPEYLTTRVDWSEKTRKTVEKYFDLHILPTFGDVDPHDLTTQLVQGWVNRSVENGAAPASVRAYLSQLAQMLDWCEIDPNPARRRTLRKPAMEEKIEMPPTGAQVLAMLERLSPAHHLLAFATIEQTGARGGEVECWVEGDVDMSDPTDPRVLSRAQYVKGRRGRRQSRWVQIPAWLFDLFPLSGDPEAKVFPDYTLAGLRAAMRTACAGAGIPHFHPHDLRHRRISLWHAQGLPAREIGDRVGHRLTTTTLNGYTHSMPPAEVATGDWLRLLAGVTE